MRCDQRQAVAQTQGIEFCRTGIRVLCRFVVLLNRSDRGQGANVVALAPWALKGLLKAF